MRKIVPDKMNTAQFINIVSTLVTNGFHIAKVDRLPHENNIFHIYKFDKLGAKVNYSILFTDDKVENSLTDTLIREAETFTATALIICDKFISSKCTTYTKQAFFNFFGGIIDAGLILVPDLIKILNELGHNKLPNGLSGKANDLLELYVQQCLQFIVESPARRYGIDRSYESVPDTVVLCRDGFMILVDSKAYQNGFDFSADDLRRFKDYVEDFRSRYSAFFGPVFSFLVVSGHFNDSVAALENRSLEFYKECGSKLAFIESKQLAQITEKLKESPEIRRSITWKNIFSNIIIDDKVVDKEITRITKDKIH